MSILGSISETYFWDNWESKFSLNHKRYVRPYDREVQRVVADMDISTVQSDVDIAKDVSSWIRNNHQYDLAKRWRTPKQTINEGKGDCEDYVFLLASMLPHFGVTEFTIAAGDSEIEQRTSFHVWLEIDGEVIDPTASKTQAQMVEYNSELEFDIEVNGY